MWLGEFKDEFWNVCNEFWDPVDWEPSAGWFKSEPDGTMSKKEIAFKLQQAKSAIKISKAARKIINLT